MKKLLPILLIAVACNKQYKELITPVQERKIEKTDCSTYLPVDASKIPARKPSRPNNNVRVTATAFASYFDGSATVVLSFNAKPPINIYRRVVGETATTFIFSTTKKRTHYSDDKARAATSYVYIVNGVESNVVTTFDAPIVGGGEEKPVVYLNPHGGLVTEWGTWVSYVGPTGQDNIDSTRNVYDREISKKYNFNFIVTTDSNVFKATHYTKRVQIFLTDDYQWYGNMAGGVAYVGSFGKEQPAFVFPILLYYNINYVNFATGHEGCHTMGLWHAKETCDQSYGLSSNWMAGNYNYTPEQRFLGESVLSGTEQGCLLINQLLTVKNKLGI